jgi:diguanylate cyclase (GGDEF)-like protein
MTAYDNASLFARVQELAVSDELTGISNRRHFFEVAERDVAKARRSGRPLVVVMADIDHFKRVNDTYGHPTGDDVIRVVASRLAAEIRATDLLGRYGGEEFALVLLDAAVGSDLPERLRQAIGDVPIQTRSGPLDITVSIGMTRLLPDDVDIAAPLARADQGLYEAKRNGRNQVQSA